VLESCGDGSDGDSCDMSCVCACYCCGVLRAGASARAVLTHMRACVRACRSVRVCARALCAGMYVQQLVRACMHDGA
jgi:hypothetical protein